MDLTGSSGEAMRAQATPMRERGKERHKRDIEAAEPVSADLTINHEQPAQYKRPSKVASFQQSSATDPQPLPPLHDVEPRRMGPNGFVLASYRVHRRRGLCPFAVVPVACASSNKKPALKPAGQKTGAESCP
ncbi:hypothetical protein [Paraburkholderia atlantica]|uniref:hypothetical protein n=2 Tax=Paraburkholderia atlantica TaxID=2654982 RepID=UPI0017E45021|nr:hypothetical protein [Paraburkholderia atlantica]MBB5417567.1 hypothetical protein [Paraburkholderia atlantica]